MAAVSLRSKLTSLNTLLAGSFGAPEGDLPAILEDCGLLNAGIIRALGEETLWDPEEVLEPCLSAIILLDHLGAPEEAILLLDASRRAAAANPFAQARFASIELVIRSRHGQKWNVRQLPISGGGPLGSDVGRLMDNVVLAERYSPYERIANDLTEYHSEPDSSGAITHFALTSMAFDKAIFAARLSDARVMIRHLELGAATIMAELGDGHPYLGLVLLTLASAKCALAAVEGNVQDLRRYADVLAVAVQRASAQLGAGHPHTIGGLANLAHAEFEIALASRSPGEVTQCLDNLAWLAERARRVCGEDHPTVVILAMNAAVAELESARQARSIERIEAAERKLAAVAATSEARFGAAHPCTAIARSNAAAAGFDVARAQRSRPALEHMAGVLEETLGQVSESLGAEHATARALTRQLAACRQLLGSDEPWTDDSSGAGVATIVRTAEDELWGLDDDYVPVYETSPRDGLLAAIDSAISYFNDGDVVEGTVVEVADGEVQVDVGHTITGVIPAKELTLRRGVDPAELVNVGDPIETVVLHRQDKDGRLILSKKRAEYLRTWEVVERLREADEPIKGTVIEVVKGGLILDVGLRGFLPASLVELRRVRNLRPYLGKELEAKIIEVDRDRNQVILSRRGWLEETRDEVRDGFFNQLRKGQIRAGVVSSIVNFGAFVDLGGVDGLVHVSELSWTHIDHPSEAVQVGQEVTVEVLSVDLDRKSVSLSLRATQEDPWHRFARTHSIGDMVPGTVTNLVPFGAFVRVDDHIEGLVHTSEMPRPAPDSPTVMSGTEVTVKITDIDLQRRRISLSLKQATTPSPPPVPLITDPVLKESLAALREKPVDDS